MPIQLKVQGDPRRPAEVRPFQRPKLNMDEMPPDMFLICGLALGLISLVFKAQVCAWGSLLLCLCGVASAKTGQGDLKQIVSSVTFACFGLFSCYLQPLRERLPPPQQ